MIPAPYIRLAKSDTFVWAPLRGASKRRSERAGQFSASQRIAESVAHSLQDIDRLPPAVGDKAPDPSCHGKVGIPGLRALELGNASASLSHAGKQSSGTPLIWRNARSEADGAPFTAGRKQRSQSMKQMSLRKVAIATSTFACAALLSFGWSEQRGVSLSIESAQARVGRPLTPLSVAGVARRQNRRAAYGYGAGAVGAGVVGAGLAGTAAVAAAATQPWGWGDPGYNRGGPYVGGRALAANAYYGGPVETSPFYLERAYHANGPWYGYNGWSDYKARAAIVCDPGSLVKGGDGQMHVCQ